MRWISRESDATKEMYGLDEEVTPSYGRRCLMARRLVERGVRFVQISSSGRSGTITRTSSRSCGTAAENRSSRLRRLIRDLKQRGLLDSTLIIWGGEFGRMPVSQMREGVTAGRDHGPAGFTVDGWRRCEGRRFTAPPTISDIRPSRIA